jgi:NAD(P)-dependent dehydrogenase (short-subunit alcohol dehydrogenase family)
MQMDLPQQVASSRSVIVTGAAQGLGLAIARRFAAAGSRVLLVDRDPKVLPQIGEEGLPQGRCFAMVQDLQDTDAARVIFVNALAKLGSVDTLINNAAWSLHRPLLETTLEDFDQIVAVNQRAPFFLTQELFRYISNSPVEVRDPVVVNVASVNALAGNARLIAYAGTKGALAAMTRAMAVEMAPRGIRVVSISPGAVDTPFEQKATAEAGIDIRRRFDKFLIKRYTTCEEIAELVLFLCGSACACVTGANWVIDGGYLAQ